MSDEPNDQSGTVVGPEEFLKKSREKRRKDAANKPACPDEPTAMLTATAQGLANKGYLTIFDIIRLIRDAGFNLSYNSVLMRRECNGSSMHDGIDGVIIDKMRQVGELADMKSAKVLKDRRAVQDAIAQAHFELETSPIKDYLLMCWRRYEDVGEGAFDKLCSYFTDRNATFKIFFRRWMLGCVGREMDGFQNHTLVLQGNQGIGKSTFAKWLCKDLGTDYFQEGPIIPSDKDHKLRLCKKFIWAADEFEETLGRSSAAALKAFLTQETVSERPAYGKNEIQAARHCNIIATINSEQFLRDVTGNRRYIIANLDAIDHAYSAGVTPEAVWADIVEHYLVYGERGDLSAAEKAQQAQVNEESEEESTLEIFLNETFEKNAGHRVPAMQVHSRVFTRFNCLEDQRESDRLMKLTKAILCSKWGLRCPRHAEGRFFIGLRLKSQ